MRRYLLPVVFITMIGASSCEKTYSCKCSVAGTEQSEILQITAWYKGRAEVKCMAKNNAGPDKEGYYNCAIKEKAAP